MPRPPRDLATQRVLEACAEHFGRPVSRGCLACNCAIWPVPDEIRDSMRSVVSDGDVVIVHEPTCPAMAGRRTG